MIRMRDSQVEALQTAWRRAYIESMCARLRGHFAAELQATSAAELHASVDAALLRAASYGLHSERDACRFLNLAVLYGWDIGTTDATAWMHRILADPDISTPSARIDSLVSHCIHRAEVAENNARLRLQAGVDSQGGNAHA